MSSSSTPLVSRTMVQTNATDSAANSAAGKTVGKPCRLVVYNKAGVVVGADVTADSFMDFKRRRGTNTAVVVELAWGEEIFVSTC